MGARIIVGGGIGAGKSTVLDALADSGFFVIEADRVGHQVLDISTDSGRAVADRWPETVVDGALSRPRIAAIVFSDPSELEALEAITHPAIRSAIDKVVSDLGDRQSIALEVPLIGLMKDGWTRVAVVAPVDVRVARAVARGGSEEDIRARMEHQPTDEEWVEWADHVIDNGGTMDETARIIAQVVSGVSA